MKIFYAFLILLLGTTSTVEAQEILFSKPFRAQDRSTFEVLGKVGEHFIVLEKAFTSYDNSPDTLLRFFDKQMQQVGGRKKIDLPPGASNLRFLAYDSFLVKIYFQESGNKVFLIAEIMDGFTFLNEVPIILDSMTYPLVSWDVVPSQDKSKLLVLRLKSTPDSASISTTIFNARLQKLQSSDFKILLNQRQEVIGQFLISNEGDTYFTVHPLRSVRQQFEILSKPFTEKYYRSLLIDLKKKYLNFSTLRFTIEEGPANGRLLINATYSSSINAAIDEGFFSTRVNGNKHVKSRVYSA